MHSSSNILKTEAVMKKAIKSDQTSFFNFSILSFWYSILSPGGYTSSQTLQLIKNSVPICFRPQKYRISVMSVQRPGDAWCMHIPLYTKVESVQNAFDMSSGAKLCHLNALQRLKLESQAQVVGCIVKQCGCIQAFVLRCFCCVCVSYATAFDLCALLAGNDCICANQLLKHFLGRNCLKLTGTGAESTSLNSRAFAHCCQNKQ